MKLRRLLGKLRRRFSPPPLVLLYHRVAAPEIDAQLLSVSPKHFSEHLAVLRDRVVPFAELSKKIRDDQLPSRAVAITFDDGYVDNLHHAKPALEAAGQPAMIYIPTGFVGANREFWWDALESLLLYPGRLPENVTLRIGDLQRTWSLDAAALYGEEAFARHRAWDIFQDTTPTARHMLYRELCDFLKPLTSAAQDDVLARLRSQLEKHRAPAEERRCVSAAELHALAGGSLIDIGAHTVTHRWLSGATPGDQANEIRESKTTLERLLARPVEHLSFPYGNYTADTTAAARDAGYATAVTTEERPLRRGEDCFQIPRLIVRDWDGATFAQRLAAWQQA